MRPMVATINTHKTVDLHLPLQFDVSDLSYVKLEQEIPAETASVHGFATVSHTSCLGTFPQELSFSIRDKEIDYVGDVKIWLRKETVASHTDLVSCWAAPHESIALWWTDKRQSTSHRSHLTLAASRLTFWSHWMTIALSLSSKLNRLNTLLMSARDISGILSRGILVAYNNSLLAH